MSSSLVLILACLDLDIRAEGAAIILDPELPCQGQQNSKVEQPGFLMTLELAYRSWSAYFWTTFHVWEKQISVFYLSHYFFFSVIFSQTWSCAVLSHFSCVQLFVTPWTAVHQAPLSMGFSRQEYWSGFPCPPLVDLPDPGTESISRASPALQADSSMLSHWGSPKTWS